MRGMISLVAAGAALSFAVPASAATQVVLYDQINLAKQSVTNQSFTFTATDPLTTLNFQGFDIPGTLTLVNLFFGTAGSTFNIANNLLAGQTFTATASGCSAPFNSFGVGADLGTYGARNLTFGGTCQGLYDTLSSSVETTLGQSYTLRYSLSSSSAQSAGGTGLRVSVGAIPVAGVPEPATWAMMLLGFGGIGFLMRRRRREGGALRFA